MTLTLPADTGAFYFYVEPNPFATFNFTATANNGTFLTLSANGAAGARGFGFFADPGQSILSITINTNTDFAVGEFGIAKSIPAPEPTSLAVFGLAALAAGGYGWRRRKLAAAA